MRWIRAIECAALFAFAPAALAACYRMAWLPTRTLFPALWLLALIAAALLLTDPTFPRSTLWNWAGLRGQWARILGRFALAAAALTALLALLEPARLLELPRHRTGLWLVIMFGYPVASVYAQELAFRTLFFHRYRVLFTSPRALAWASTLLFAAAHIVMQNPWAVAFSVPGGWLFADTFRRTNSTAAACVEHTLYGCFIFTIGWGAYFYAGSAR